MPGIFAGAIDTGGGTILEKIISSTKPRGMVACCGNVASPELQLSVYPFILRAVSLIGISSQDYPDEDRIRVWEKLAGEWKPGQLDKTCNEISLDKLQDSIDQMLQGKLNRRVVVRL
jgi:NADPH:quinone reductase-like Zn-dependent oxidoreductase